MQIHAGLMFVCVSAGEFEYSSVWEVCTTPYVVKISLVLCAFFPSLFFERFYRSELRLAALYDITQRIQSWKWNKICAVTLF